MSLIHKLVTRIHVWPYRLAVILQGLDDEVNRLLGIFKEHTDSGHWARGDQRHQFLGTLDEVVMARERRRQKNLVEKKTKVTKPYQNGNRSRTARARQCKRGTCLSGAPSLNRYSADTNVCRSRRHRRRRLSVRGPDRRHHHHRSRLVRRHHRRRRAGDLF